MPVLRLEGWSDGLAATPRALVEAAKTNPTKREILRKEWAVLTQTLRQAAALQIEVMIIAGNMGCIRFQGGPAHRAGPMRRWMNVLDPGFNLPLRADHVAEVWRVS